MTRREMLLAMGVMGLASPLLGFEERERQGERSISLYNTHTQEMVTSVFWAEGTYIMESLEAINMILRDHRSNEICTMDVGLIELLYSLSSLFDHKDTFHVISGYRSKQTNDSLRQFSTGVAQNSFHTKGQAIDIYLPKIELSDVREAALYLNRGGVGYYPSSGFVHVDTGHVRNWHQTPKVPSPSPLMESEDLPFMFSLEEGILGT